jgi:putative acetyltransferase
VNEPRVEVVEARDDHAAGLIELIQSVFSEYEGVLFLLEELPELRRIASSFRADDGRFWCALRAGRIVGCVGFTASRDPDGVELKKLYVARSERRRGLGDHLTRMVEQEAARRGKRFVELWSDTRFTTAHRFYRRRGYRDDGATRELGDASRSRELYFRKRLSDG